MSKKSARGPFSLAVAELVQELGISQEEKNRFAAALRRASQTGGTAHLDSWERSWEIAKNNARQLERRVG